MSPGGKTVYLNNSATTFPKPEAVYRAADRAARRLPVDCRRGGGEDVYGDGIETCRRLTASFFGAPASERIIFTSGSTLGLNFTVRGLDLKSGDSVVFTNMEHNSVIRPLKHLESDTGVILRILSLDTSGIIHIPSLKKMIDHTTKAVFINHASNVLGTVQDIKAVSDVIIGTGALLIVDASQSAGIVPIDVIRDRIDILVFTGHKHLYGFPGIGGMYLREGLELKPLITGGTGVRSDLLTQPEEMPVRLEAGTPNLPGIASLSAGIKFIQETGIDAIGKKLKSLREYCVAKMLKVPDLTVFASESGSQPVISFRMRGLNVEDLGLMLEDSFNIKVRSGLHCAPLAHHSIGTSPEGTVRASFSFFTTEEDIDVLIAALYQISRSVS